MDNRAEAVIDIFTQTIDSELSCPIIEAPLFEPLVASDGFSYDKTAIEEHIQQAQQDGSLVTSPRTDLPLSGTKLVSNRSLKKLVLAWFNDELALTHDIKHISPIHCPLTGRVMQDPIITTDGYSFEKSAFSAWIRICEKKYSCTYNPVTNKLLTDTTVIPNYTLKGFIQSWINASNNNRVKNIYSQLAFERSQKEKQVLEKLEKLPWWEEEKRLWVKARLAKQKFIKTQQLQPASKNHQLKLISDVEYLDGNETAEDARFLLTQVTGISKETISQLMHRALAANNESLAKVLLYCQPRLITVEELILIAKTQCHSQEQENNQNNRAKLDSKKLNLSFLSWIVSCLDLESDIDKIKAHEFVAEFGTKEMMQAILDDELIRPMILEKALNNINHPQVFLLLWHHKNIFMDINEERNHWRTKLAIKAVKNKQEQAAQAIINGWPENTEKSSLILQAALLESHLALTTKLLDANFALPEKPYALLIKKHNEEIARLIQLYNLNDIKKLDNYIVRITCGLYASIFSIFSSQAFIYDFVPTYSKWGISFIFASLACVTIIVLTALIGTHTLYSALLHQHRRKSILDVQEQCSYKICLALNNKINITAAELIQLADMVVKNDIQEASFKLLFDSYLSSNNNDINQLALTENLPDSPPSHSDENRDVALIETYSTQDWWLEEAKQWQSTVKNQKSQLLKQGVAIITPSQIKKMEDEIEEAVKNDKPLDTIQLRKLLCLGATLSNSNQDLMFESALEKNNISIIKLLIYYKPSVVDSSSLIKVLINHTEYNKHKCLCFIYHLITTQDNTDDNRPIEYIVNYGDIRSVKKFLNPSHMSLDTLFRAARNTTDREVFPFVWNHYQALLISSRKEDELTMTAEKHQKLATAAFDSLHLKAIKLLCTDKSMLPNQSFERVVKSYINSYEWIKRVHDRAEKDYTNAYSKTGMACSSIVILFTVYCTQLYIKNTLTQYSPSDAYVIKAANLVLISLAIGLSVSITGYLAYYLYDGTLGPLKLLLTKMQKEINTLDTSCLGIISILADFGLKPSNEVLELVADDFNQAKCSKTIFDAVFNLAEGNYHHNTLYRYSDFAFGLFAHTKEHISAALAPRLA